MGTDPEKRNWKGIIIAVLVILIVFAFIGIAVYFVTPGESVYTGSGHFRQFLYYFIATNADEPQVIISVCINFIVIDLNLNVTFMVK